MITNSSIRFFPHTNAATFLSRETSVVDRQTARGVFTRHVARDTQPTLTAYVQWRAEQISKLSLTTTRHPDVQRQTYRQTDGETVVIIVNSTTLTVYTDVHTSDKTLVSRLRYYAAWTRATVRFRSTKPRGRRGATKAPQSGLTNPGLFNLLKPLQQQRIY